MKELIEFIAKSLVDSPEDVSVSETSDDSHIFLKLHVASSDIGKIIGKKGKIAKAIRTVVKAASSKTNKRVIVDIED